MRLRREQSRSAGCAGSVGMSTRARMGASTSRKRARGDWARGLRGEADLAARQGKGSRRQPARRCLHLERAAQPAARACTATRDSCALALGATQRKGCRRQPARRAGGGCALGATQRKGCRRQPARRAWRRVRRRARGAATRIRQQRARALPRAIPSAEYKDGTAPPGATRERVAARMRPRHRVLRRRRRLLRYVRVLFWVGVARKGGPTG
jgi:hypothetical protein